MGIQHPPMAMCAGEQHSWEHLPDNLSQSNSSHCQSAMSSERGKITSPGKFLSGHFMQNEKKKKGGWEGAQGDPGYSKASEAFLLKPCQEQEKVLCFVPMHRSENLLRLGFPSYECSWRKKHTHTQSWLALFSRYWKSDCHLCQISSWQQSWLALQPKTASQWQQKIHHDLTSNWVCLFFLLQPHQA